MQQHSTKQPLRLQQTSKEKGYANEQQKQHSRVITCTGLPNAGIIHPRQL